MSDEEIALKAAKVVDRFSIEEHTVWDIAEIILAAIKKAEKEKARGFWHEGKDE